MTTVKARSNAIAAQTNAFAKRLTVAREAYWRALLARSRLAAPIAYAVRIMVETEGWDRRLGRMVSLARRAIETRRITDHRVYLAAVKRAAVWLAEQDRGCDLANGCTDAIALWAGRRLPEIESLGPNPRASEASALALGAHRLYPARIQSATWRHYWHDLDQARRERERLRNAIVTTNEGLVIQQVNKWVPWAEGHLSREDLQQAGREGLFRAADLFDPTRGFRFSTYACGWIRHHVFRLHQHARSDVLWPTGIQQLALQIAPAVEQGITDPEALQAFLVERAIAKIRASKKPDRQPRKPPSATTITTALGYLGVREVSMDARLGRDDGGRPMTLQDVVASEAMTPEEAAIRHEDEHQRERVTARLLAAVQGLDPRDREVVAMRFGLGGTDALTLTEVARRLGRRRAEIEAVESATLAHLRGRVVDLAGHEHANAVG